MGSPLLIGFGAGLVAAVLFASLATGSLLAIALFYLAPLPGFLAGLGWGTVSALVAGLTGAAVTTAGLGVYYGLAFLLALGVPTTVLCYLALLSREVGPPAGEGADQPQVEWYPPGRIIAWATVMIGALVALAIPIIGRDAQSYRATVRDLLDKTVLGPLGADAPQGLDKGSLDPIIELFVHTVPAAFAIVGLGVMLFNLWAAGRIVDYSGRPLRPWPDLSRLTYPGIFSLGFVAALLATFAPGLLGIAAMGFAGAFLLAYLLLGLVILHVISRATPLRPFVLFLLYIGVARFVWVALIVAVIGLGDPVFKLRERGIGKRRPPASKAD